MDNPILFQWIMNQHKQEEKTDRQLLQTQAMDLFLTSLRNYSDSTKGSMEALLHTSKRKVDVLILHFVAVSQERGGSHKKTETAPFYFFLKHSPLTWPFQTCWGAA